MCKECVCDRLQIVQSSAYSSLVSDTGTCGRLSDNNLEYRRLLGDPNWGSFQPATRIYVRFVSDDTVHRKGFNLSFVAQSYIHGKFIE